MTCGDSGSKAFACNARDFGRVSGSGRSSGEGNGYPLQFSCLENSTDRGAWWATVHGSQRVRHDRTTNTFTFLTGLHATHLTILLHRAAGVSSLKCKSQSIHLEPPSISEWSPTFFTKSHSLVMTNKALCAEVSFTH